MSVPFLYHTGYSHLQTTAAPGHACQNLPGSAVSWSQEQTNWAVILKCGHYRADGTTILTHNSRSDVKPSKEPAANTVIWFPSKLLE